MPSIWNGDVRADLADRVRRLTPGHTARWGKFTAGAMLAHLNDASRMALGELPVARTGPWLLRFAPVRYLIIHVLPMPKSAPTAPELLARTGAVDFRAEQAAFAELFERVARRPSTPIEHPAFGRLTHHDLGVLMHKHTDHHLKQFGG